MVIELLSKNNNPTNSEDENANVYGTQREKQGKQANVIQHVTEVNLKQRENSDSNDEYARSDGFGGNGEQGVGSSIQVIGSDQDKGNQKQKTADRIEQLKKRVYISV